MCTKMDECKSLRPRGLLCWLNSHFIVLALSVAMILARAGGEMEQGSGSGGARLTPAPDNTSNTDEPLGNRVMGANNTDLSRCISVSEAVNRSLIFSACIDFVQSTKSFIYDYNVDFDQLKQDLNILNAALETSPFSSPPCMDLARAYTCNYMYPGCNIETGLPQGICKAECEKYVLNSLCFGEFNTLEDVTRSVGRFRFTRQCENTLLLLQDTGIDTEGIDYEDCINITETLSNMTLSGIIKFPDPLEPDTTQPPSALTPIYTTIESTAPPDSFNLSRLLAVILSTISVVLLSLLAMVVIVVNICRAKKGDGKAKNPLESYTITNHYAMGGTDKVKKQVNQDLFHLSEEDVQAFCKDEALKKALVPTDNLYITGELGEGAFGRVFKGLLVTEDPEEESGRKVSQIAIKTVKNTQGMYRELKAFIEESALMCSFDHPHVMGTVGICLDTLQSPYLLLPYMANGDLRTFLRNKRETAKSTYPEGLDYNVLVRMCYEVARGMEYLASKKLVHRDLAARNCMVDRDLNVKVADFGLARVIYQTDYYRQHQQTKVPVKWMAPESLHDMISTEKSDVWSYGVVCWEVFSLGRLPYPTLANHEVVDYLERGNRLKKPALCSDIMYELMASCWSEGADKRPTFSEIVSWYHDGIIPGTSKVDEEVEGYVLLGPEEQSKTASGKREKAKNSLTDTSVMDITMIDKREGATPIGTTFDVVFLHQSLDERESSSVANQPDSDYYIEMSSLSSQASVITNPIAADNDYDSVHDETKESERKNNGHVTTAADHMTYSNKLDAIGEYVVMQSAEPVALIK